MSAITIAVSTDIISLIGATILVNGSFPPYLPSLNAQALTQTHTLKNQVGEQTSFTSQDG
jgi:transmembrane sensor